MGFSTPVINLFSASTIPSLSCAWTVSSFKNIRYLRKALGPDDCGQMRNADQSFTFWLAGCQDYLCGSVPGEHGHHAWRADYVQNFVCVCLALSGPMAVCRSGAESSGHTHTHTIPETHFQIVMMCCCSDGDADSFPVPVSSFIYTLNKIMAKEKWSWVNVAILES